MPFPWMLAGGLGVGLLGSLAGRAPEYPEYGYTPYQFEGYEPGQAETMGIENLMGTVGQGYDPSQLMSPEVIQRLMPAYEAAMAKAMPKYREAQAGLMEQLNLGGTLYSPGARAAVGERVGRPMAQELTGIMAGLPREAFGMGMQMQQLKRGDLASLLGYGQQQFGRQWGQQAAQAGEHRLEQQVGIQQQLGQYGAQEQRASDIQKLFGGIGAGMVEYGMGQAMPQPDYEGMMGNLFRQYGGGGVSPWGG